ncbi:MAG: hypothetical protein F6K26_53170, partial [Moorea sp. SIO2I5]|nr:hypothetical protein [Moorena sp. SIO2I5]
FSSYEDLDWITALTAPQIKKLAEQKVIQLGLFDEQNLVEVESVDYPEVRPVANLMGACHLCRAFVLEVDYLLPALFK